MSSRALRKLHGNDITVPSLPPENESENEDESENVAVQEKKNLFELVGIKILPVIAVLV